MPNPSDLMLLMTGDEVHDLERELAGTHSNVPLAGPTEHGHQVCLTWLREFLDKRDPGSSERVLCPGGEPIATETWKAFVNVKTKTRLQNPSNALIGNSLQLKGVIRDLYSTISAYQRLTGTMVEKRVKKDVAAYICSTLVDLYDLHTEIREKHTATPSDWRRLIKACYDPSLQWKTPRERTQIVFLLMSVTFGVSRPGEYVTSAGYELDNEALTWKDVQFFATTNVHTGRVEVQMIVRLRFLKGKRKTPEHKDLTLRPMSDPAFDGTLPLLALAAEDGILKHLISSLYKITPAQLAKHNGRILIPVDHSKDDLRVVRSTVRVSVSSGLWTTHETEGQTTKMALYHLKRIARAAGCLDNVTWFTFRRCTMDLMNSTEFTESDRRAAAGHNNASRIQDRAYISKNTVIDNAGMVTGEQPVSDAAASVRGLSFFDGGPATLSRQSQREILDDPTVTKLRDTMLAARSEMMEQFATVAEARAAGGVAYTQYETLRLKYHALLRALRRDRFREEVVAAIDSSIASIFEEIEAEEEGTTQPEPAVDNSVASIFEEIEAEEEGTEPQPAGADPEPVNAGPEAVDAEPEPVDADVDADGMLEEDETVPLFSPASVDQRAQKLADAAAAIQPQLLGGEPPEVTLAAIMRGDRPSPTMPDLIDMMRHNFGGRKGNTARPGERLDSDHLCPCCRRSWPEIKPDATELPPPLRDQTDHVHTCIREDLVAQLLKAAVAVSDQPAVHCPRATCNAGPFAPGDLFNHLSYNHSKAHICQVPKDDGTECRYQLERGDLSQHMEMEHGFLVTQAKPGQARYAATTLSSSIQYCELCQLWLCGATHLRAHMSGHISDLEAQLEAASDNALPPGVCPFCIADRTLLPEWRANQYDKLHEHINTHVIKALVDDKTICCPWTSCNLGSCAPADLADHLIKVHHLPLAGNAPGTRAVLATIGGDLAKLKLSKGSRNALNDNNTLQGIDPMSLEALEKRTLRELRTIAKTYHVQPYGNGAGLPKPLKQLAKEIHQAHKGTESGDEVALLQFKTHKELRAIAKSKGIGQLEIVDGKYRNKRSATLRADIAEHIQREQKRRRLSSSAEVDSGALSPLSSPPPSPGPSTVAVDAAPTPSSRSTLTPFTPELMTPSLFDYDLPDTIHPDDHGLDDSVIDPELLAMDK